MRPSIKVPHTDYVFINRGCVLGLDVHFLVWSGFDTTTTTTQSVLGMSLMTHEIFYLEVMSAVNPLRAKSALHLKVQIFFCGATA